MKTLRIFGKFVAAIAVLAIPFAANAQTVEGAGATFPSLMYRSWVAKYKSDTGVTVNYQSVGSGAGVKAFIDKTVDFGATDSPLTDAEESQAKGQGLHIPTVGGTVVLAYNVPGAPNNIKLTGTVIADIFLGKIRTWNDKAITDLNPGVNMPPLAIQPIHRTDGSGTTYIFTSYLKAVSSAWASGPGAAKSVSWPVGLGGRGNEGVAAVTRRTRGAIGYVELAFAVDNKLPFAQVRNKAGRYITATPETGASAIAQFASKLGGNVKFPTVDAPGADSYPITGLTFVLIYKNGGRNTAGAVKFLEWAMQPSQQSMAPANHYVPLPKNLIDINLKALKGVRK